MRRNSRLAKSVIRSRFFVALALVSGMFLLAAPKASAYVQVDNNQFLDALAHLNGLEPGQIFRNWAGYGLTGNQNPANPYCEVEVTDVYDLAPGPNGPRKAYRFKAIGNADGRAHALEAAGYVDSSTTNCSNTHNSAWNGRTVNLNDPIFANPISGASKTRPINVTLGLNNADEDQAALQGFRQNFLSGWLSFDVAMKRTAGIKPTTNGGGYGYIGDAGGYKVNGQTIWCAGVDIGNLTGVNNIRWPGTFHNDCRWDHRFKAGTNTPGDGNFETNWGAFAFGVMGAHQLNSSNNETSVSSPALRCIATPCPIGSDIPNITRTSGMVDNFELIVAGVKNHDGAGTFQGNPDFAGEPAPFNDIDWRARNLGGGNPYPVPFAEAWLVMEWEDDGGSSEENPEITCTGVQLSPQNPQPGESFDATMQYTYKGSGDRIEFFSEVIGVDNEENTVQELTLGNSGGVTVISGDPGFPPINLNTHDGPAGSYSYVAWIQIKDQPNTRSNCGGTAIIAAKPYFKVWTNDVQIGGGFKDSMGSCSVVDSDATVIGYGGDGSTNVFKGATAEYGLFALGEVRNFTSVGRRSPRTTVTGDWPTPPHGWTVANAQIAGIPNGDPGDGNKVVNYGGLSEMGHCSRDWFSTDNIPAGAQVLDASVNSVTAGGSGAVHVTKGTGNFTVTSGQATGPRAIFVPDEDVTVLIDDDISAVNGATLYIIAAGDIKIKAKANSIQAALITKQSLHTCVNEDGSAVSRPQMYNTCGRNNSGKLVVWGAVIANEVKLQRTYGTQHQSNENEGLWNGSAPIIYPNQAAEEFVFDPTLYYTTPAINIPEREKNQIDYITSLPPLL